MKKIPNAAYRLQFNKDFTFNSAVEIFSYLHALGLTCIYASPIWHAKKGSVHGYDVVEPAEINPELGSADDFAKFKKGIKAYGFGWLQDIVPNHMAYSSENQMLTDLLENGKNSRYYNFFDIDWDHPHLSVRNRILAPFLGKLYRECLEAGEIKLSYDSSGFSVSYYENRLPLKIETYAEILSFGLNDLVSALGRENPDIIKYLGVVYFLRALPSAEELNERYYQIMFIKEILWELYSDNPFIRNTINKTIGDLNGIPGNPASFDLLNNILSTQNFRLCYWKVAVEEINYRRFFNINELISLRMEDEQVFKRTHVLISKLVNEKEITGLRIDHVDGLYDPAAYLEKLRDMNSDLYIIVEKILADDENLPVSWPVDGSTGYEYLNYLNGLFVNPENLKTVNSVYQRYIRKLINSSEVANDKKRLIIRTRMAGEVEKLAYLIEAISSSDRYGIDITMVGLKAALEEILTFFPVYRTYITEKDYSEQDKGYIDYVINKAKKDNPRFTNEIEYIGSILKLNFHEQISDEQKKRALDFIMRFQQLTGPLMAKGFEDTTFYVYNRFISINEVGCNPERFGVRPEDFHDFNIGRLERWPHSMNASSTHDTKRGEDARARLNVLSEIPEEWDEKVRLWNKINKREKKTVGQVNAPDRNDEYFLYQSIVGSFPFSEDEIPVFKERMKNFIIKAVREAKVHTAWIKPDEEYEAAFTQFVGAILTGGSKFLEDFNPFIKKISAYGVYNSVSQTIIKFLSPGVPDIYQGSELWNLSLVDPDNRAPVDYETRKKYLNGIINELNEKGSVDVLNLLKEPAPGKIKLYLTYVLLQERNKNPDLYSKGEYIPLYAVGSLKNNIIGFARKHEDKYAVILSGRFFTNILTSGGHYSPEIWQGTNITISEKRKLRNLFTGEEIVTGETLDTGVIFKTLPFAVLVDN